ncbi:MAG: hypothetical protein JO187_06650 [Acidobacteria bacterium]|nr:hypothetical protein [Acidobacteriota bacterium]
MRSKTSFRSVVLFAVFIAIGAFQAFALEHATAGVLSRVDSAAKTIVVKTADGTEEVFKFTGKTAVHGAKDVETGAVDTYLAGKEGTHVVVRYTEKGTEKTAVGVEDVGKDTMKVAKGTVEGADKAGHTITVAGEDGSKDTYHVAKDAAIDSEHGVVKGTEFVGKNGEKVTVHYTEEGGKKVVHFIKHF